jgi:hypothetical protein
MASAEIVTVTATATPAVMVPWMSQPSAQLEEEEQEDRVVVVGLVDWS